MEYLVDWNDDVLEEGFPCGVRDPAGASLEAGDVANAEGGKLLSEIKKKKDRGRVRL